MSNVTFPQPEALAPADLSIYFFVSAAYEVEVAKFSSSDKHDLARLRGGNIYLVRELAEQRAVWNAQEMARLVIPAWFRALGPDVQFELASGEWVNIEINCIRWDLESPKRYRSKPRDVVVTVNGKEFRWPSTVRQGDPAGMRYVSGINIVMTHLGSTAYGPMVHHTSLAAEVQLAAIRAAAGVNL